MLLGVLDGDVAIVWNLRDCRQDQFTTISSLDKMEYGKVFCVLLAMYLDICVIIIVTKFVVNVAICEASHFL